MFFVLWTPWNFLAPYLDARLQQHYCNGFDLQKPLIFGHGFRSIEPLETWKRHADQ
jgi:hypothetical protein